MTSPPEFGRFSFHEHYFNYQSGDPNHIFSFHPHKMGGRIPFIVLARPRRRAGVTHTVLAPRSFRWRFLAWKIGPLSLPLPSSPLPLPHILTKAAEPGCSLVTASAVSRCSECSPTSSRTSSLTSPGPQSRT